MRLSYKFNIDFTEELKQQFVLAKNLYNQANHHIKEIYKKEGKYCNYYDMDKYVKNLPEEYNNYRKIIKVQSAQQILKQLDKNWKSFFKSIKDFKKYPNKYKGCPKPPKYKEELQSLIFTNQSCKIKDNILFIGKGFKPIKLPKYVDFSNFNQVMLIPKKKHIEVIIIYSRDCINSNADINRYMSIDLGIDNLATCVSEDSVYIISGKIIKSKNQWFNKVKARLKSQQDNVFNNNKKKGRWLNKNKLEKLSNHRDIFINDYLHKVSKFIVNSLLKQKVGNLIIGYNKDWKDSSNIGKVNNQKFINIPYLKLIQNLEYKCELVGIKVIKTEESYTSKCDSLANEKISKHEKYLGKRIFRGLFKSSNGKVINADVNGALNIMKKVVDESYVNKIINRGFGYNPVKIRSLFNLDEGKLFQREGIKLCI